MKRFIEHLKRRARCRRGYSLVDVLIGVVVLTFALGSAFSLSIHNARLMERNAQLSAAALLARYKMEELRNFEYADVVSGADDDALNSLGEPGGIFTRTWTVVDNAPSVGLKTVTVFVTWEQWGEGRSYRMRGVISQ